MTLTTNKAERKARPIARGVLDYFPDALAEVAYVSYVGNEQHNPGQPLHWNKTKSQDHADCIMRHMIDRGLTDDDGLRHSAKVAWRALAMLQIEIERGGGGQATASGPNPHYRPEPLDIVDDRKHLEERIEKGLKEAFQDCDGCPEFRENCTCCKDPRKSTFVFHAAMTEDKIADELERGLESEEPTDAEDDEDAVAHRQFYELAMQLDLVDEYIDRAVGAVELVLRSNGCPADVAKLIEGGVRENMDAGPFTPVYYIAGPMRGYTAFNFPAFDKARDRLLALGISSVSPADIDRAAGDQNSGDQCRFALRDFHALLWLAQWNSKNQNAIYMLRGWELSVGAKAEHALAVWLGLNVIYEGYENV